MAVPSDRVQRIVEILRILKRDGAKSTSELAKATRAKPRTVLNDLNELDGAGAVRHVGEGKAQRWELVDGEQPHAKGVLDGIALRLGRDLLTVLEGTGLSDVFDRLEHTTDRALLDTVDRKFLHLQEPARRYSEQTDLIDTLIDGLVKEKRIALTYSGDESEVRPLTLVLYRRAVYLLALDEREDVVRLAVDRIQRAQTTSKFDYPKDWDPEAELAPWFGIYKSHAPERVVLRFSAARADLVKSRDWHPKQKLEELPDGRIQLVMHVGGAELVRFVLEWGPHCEVVAPSWLRERVRDELRGALANYGED